MKTIPSASQLETISADEAVLTQKLIALVKGKMEKDYATGTMLRDAHPKQHGCLKAEFTVDGNLPPELRIGLFSEARVYPAWIRFSSAAADVQSDAKKDMRGIAIKVMGVEGTKLLDDEPQESTQDFLMISSPVLPIGTLADFTKLVDVAINKHLLWFFFNPFDLHLRELKLAAAASKLQASLLALRYWSTTPFALGNQAVKYSLRPVAGEENGRPSKISQNYLREEMVTRLAAQDVVFDFMVQMQSGAKMPVEDASILWDESDSPFRKVATVRIPQQVFDTAVQDTFGEHLSFTPWHSLPEHRPLGNINRARKEIYRAISKFRHARNQVERKEPAGDEVL